MRKLPALIVALAMAITGSAFAAPAAPSDQPASTLISTETMQEVAGTYGLADGRRVRLFILDDQLYADINGRERLQLQALSEHVFATRNNALTVEFNPAWPDDDQVRLRFDADMKAAAPHVVAAKDRQAL
jgi:hypothetical protein